MRCSSGGRLLLLSHARARGAWGLFGHAINSSARGTRGSRRLRRAASGGAAAQLAAERLCASTHSLTDCEPRQCHRSQWPLPAPLGSNEAVR